MGEETWSTYQMHVTLSNIEPLYHEAREWAQADSTGEKLANWVSGWFRGDLSHLDASSRDAIECLRRQMNDAEWREIDWASVAEDLAVD